MILPALCQENMHRFPTTARLEGGILEAPANVLAEGAHVEHDKFWTAKHPGVDSLQDKVFFLFGIKGYKKGVIDVAISIFLDGNDLTS